MKRLPKDFTLDRYGLHVRLVDEADAEFILRLRTDPKNSPFLHVDNCTVESQKRWTREYKEREEAGKDYYFMFEHGSERVGVIRLYNIEGGEFHCGSWVFKRGLPAFFSLAGGLMAREIAFNLLGLETEKNDKDGIVSTNSGVIRYMKMLGLQIDGSRKEGERTFVTGTLTKEDFNRNKGLVIRFVPKELQI